MINRSHRMVIITPVYEDSSAFKILLENLFAVFGEEIFVIAVDDGSVHCPVNASCFYETQAAGTILKLQRNVGHQRAIATGLSFASGLVNEDHLLVIMDSDGEDRPSDIPTLIRRLGSSDVDIAVAARGQRTEALSFRLFYVFYKRLFHLLTGKAINFGNFMAMKPVAAKRLASMPELSIHIAAAALASKLRVGVCSIDRGTRYSGVSKMNFSGLVLHGFRGMMVFAEEVVVRVGLLCGGVAILTLFGALLAILLKVLGHSTPGWFSVALGVLVMIFVQTGALALMILMLSGVTRRAEIASSGNHVELIESVSYLD